MASRDPSTTPPGALSRPAAEQRDIITPLGLRLTTHVWGQAGAPPVVILHGFMDSAVAFHTAFEPLAARWRIIAPDQRGHGQSDHVGTGGYYHFPDYVLDLCAVMDVIGEPGGPKPILAGHSMGASVAVYYAGAFPENIRGLVLIDGMGPQSGDTGQAPERLRQWAAAVQSRRSERHQPVPRPRARSMERLQAAAPGLRAPAVERVLAARARSVSETHIVYRADPLHRTPSPWTFSGERFEAFCRSVTAPTLAVWGARSPFRHAEVERRQALFSDLKEVTIEGVGHNIHLEAPDRLSEVVGEFLDTLPTP